MRRLLTKTCLKAANPPGERHGKVFSGGPRRPNPNAGPGGGGGGGVFEHRISLLPPALQPRGLRGSKNYDDKDGKSAGREIMMHDKITRKSFFQMSCTQKEDSCG